MNCHRCLGHKLSYTAVHTYLGGTAVILCILDSTVSETTTVKNSLDRNALLNFNRYSNYEAYTVTVLWPTWVHTAEVYAIDRQKGRQRDDEACTASSFSFCQYTRFNPRCCSCAPPPRQRPQRALRHSPPRYGGEVRGAEKRRSLVDAPRPSLLQKCAQCCRG